MGIAYQIKCRHCGAEFNYSQNMSLGLTSRLANCKSHIETESPIRCPACMKRLNTTETEFNEQVHTAILWD
ncbi:MAG: hypothetical protein IKY82_02140 [Alistipes sp.]|nr:hypothetical protein [Alistipes sp.]